VELAEQSDADLIMMGSTGIDNSDKELGHIARRVLRMPIVLLNEIFK
jgi:nucleotide-binding universal stress UspA family protein